MPAAAREELDVAATTPEGYEARAAEWGDFTVVFESFPPIDPADLFKGLPDDRCQCHHFGYLFEGELVIRYADREETIRAGQRLLHQSRPSASGAGGVARCGVHQDGGVAADDAGRHGESRHCRVLDRAAGIGVTPCRSAVESPGQLDPGRSHRVHRSTARKPIRS